MTSDKYLQRLQKIKDTYTKPIKEKRGLNRGSLKGGYLAGLHTKEDIPRNRDPRPGYVDYANPTTDAGEDIIKDSSFSSESPSHEVGYAMGVAHQLMKSNRSMNATLLGAKIYEKVGQGGRNSVKGRLLAKFTNIAEIDPQGVAQYEQIIKDFLKRNPSPEPGNLEKSITPVAILSLIASIFFLSNNLTGYSVSSIPSSSSNLFGVILFLVGVVGSFILIKKYY